MAKIAEYWQAEANATQEQYKDYFDRREEKALAEIPEKYTDGTGLSESDFVPNADVADVIEPVLEFIDQHGLPNPTINKKGPHGSTNSTTPMRTMIRSIRTFGKR